MAVTSTSQLVKNFSSLTTLEAVTAQLDITFNKIVDLLDAKPQTHSLLDAKKRIPKHKAGDLVVDYREGVPSPGMSDGKNIQPFNIAALQGTIKNAQHGIQDSQVFDTEGVTVIGLMHSTASGSAAGFMSASDFTKLAGLTAGASPSGATPITVDASAGSPGSSANFSRGDHVHQVATGTPVAIGSSNAAGSSINLARADHVHDHGNLAGGSLHALAVGGTSAGFISASDKTLLNGLSTLAFFVSTAAGPTYFLNVTTAGGVKQVQVF